MKEFRFELFDFLIILRPRKSWENNIQSEKPHCWSELTEAFLKIHVEITAANNYSEIGATDWKADIPFRRPWSH